MDAAALIGLRVAQRTAPARGLLGPSFPRMLPAPDASGRLDNMAGPSATILKR
jgi:hypothetical protein